LPEFARKTIIFGTKRQSGICWKMLRNWSANK